MTKIHAHLKNSPGHQHVTLRTNDHEHSLAIAPNSTWAGSSVNGGELLFLALATCYCNDLYREAAKRNITVKSVQVEVSGEFGDVPGNPGEGITYSAVVEADASEDDILDLMRHTDTVAEIHNTLRQARDVTLASVQAVSKS